jgi:methionyl-tRNA formyltransferase
VVGGRDQHVKKDYFDDIEKICKSHNIPFAEKEKPVGANVDYKLAIGWRWMIQDYDNLIVMHDSLLPRYRGFAPLVNALINGEKTTGVSMLFASSEYDKGDIIFQERMEIQYPIKIQELIEKIAPLYSIMVEKAIQQLHSSNKLEGKSQDEELATYSLWRDEMDYQINWHQSADQIERFINALGFPYKGAYTMVNERKIRIMEVRVMEDVAIEIRQPGKIIFTENKKPVVVCGKGLLQLLDIRDEDNKPIESIHFRTRFQ